MFLKYRNVHPEFANLLCTAKEALIEELEHTMYEAALGRIKIRETKKFISQAGEKEQIRVEETIKRIATKSCIVDI